MPENITPDTLSYLILGIIVVVGTLLVYTTAIINRARGLRREIETLERMGSE